MVAGDDVGPGAVDYDDSVVKGIGEAVKELAVWVWLKES